MMSGMTPTGYERRWKMNDGPRAPAGRLESAPDSLLANKVIVDKGAALSP